LAVRRQLARRQARRRDHEPRALTQRSASALFSNVRVWTGCPVFRCRARHIFRRSG
jgi:hypothetical protein